MTPPTHSPTSQRGTGGGIGIRTARGRDERAHGQLHVYDGEGKGKSQAALGVVLRTIGLGICEQKRTRVLLLRFLKGPGRSYDEDAAIEALQQGFPHLIDQVRTGRGDYFTASEATPFDRMEAQRGWDIAKGALASNLYSVVVLDELNPVLDLGLLDASRLLPGWRMVIFGGLVALFLRWRPRGLLDETLVHRIATAWRLHRGPAGTPGLPPLPPPPNLSGRKTP
jgi:cob(I)alamin adenosyltransferase